MIKRAICLLAVLISMPAVASELSDAVTKDYDEHLADLFDHFHRNPELSTIEHETARRMAMELSLAGFVVVGEVGVTQKALAARAWLPYLRMVRDPSS